jgi:glycosyltransferase involved in cell wall biosynthesis
MGKGSSNKTLKVLHVAKWFPNQRDVQNGIFIKKHVDATALFAEVKVLAWLPGDGETITQESIENNWPITRVYFKKGLAFTQKRHLFRDYIRSHYNNKNLPDIIHLHIFSPDLLLIANWAKKKKIPVVISEHWSGYTRGLFHQMPYWRKWAYRRLAKVQRILPVSNVAKEAMQMCGINGKYTLVPNVVERHTKTVEKLPGYNFVVVADLIDEVKNISGIIDAFCELKSAAELHIYGGGPDEEILKSRAAAITHAKKIHFYGRKSNAEVLALLPKYQCAVVNSRVETFGLLLLEAHAAGIPAIVTRCGGPEEYIEEGDIAIPINNQKLLTDAMTEMAQRENQIPNFVKWQACTSAQVSAQLQQVYAEEIDTFLRTKTKSTQKE